MRLYWSRYMKRFGLLLVAALLAVGCGRVGDDSTSVDTSGDTVTTSGTNLYFDVKSDSTLVDANGNSYVDEGHYTMLVQSKDSSGNPVGDLANRTYTLYENTIASSAEESKVEMYQDERSTSNEVLLLLDFSGSLISDCDNVSLVSENEDNLCYQLVESAKQFINDAVSEQQPMAIYYFDSRSSIRALVTSTTAGATSDKEALIAGIEQLYNSTFREELSGYVSTNLNGAIIEATKVACSWVDACNYDNYTPQTNTNLESFEFASVVVFTDGQDTADRVTENDMLSFINDHEDLYYYTIGLGDVDAAVLKEVGRDQYIYVNQTSDLNGAFDDLSTQLEAWGNSFYQVDYCPETQVGSIDIKIKVESDVYTGIISDTITLPDDVDFRCDL